MESRGSAFAAPFCPDQITPNSDGGQDSTYKFRRLLVAKCTQKRFFARGPWAPLTAEWWDGQNCSSFAHHDRLAIKNFGDAIIVIRAQKLVLGWGPPLAGRLGGRLPRNGGMHDKKRF